MQDYNPEAPQGFLGAQRVLDLYKKNIAPVVD